MQPQGKGGLAPEAVQMHNYQTMMAVVHRMKEIPELPSEVPNDVSALERVEEPPEGGILTYMEGQDYPYRGFPFSEMVEKIDILKKVVRGILSSFFHSLKRRNKLQVLLVAFVPWLIMDTVKALIYVIYRAVERSRIKSNMYSQSMRELHRALSTERYGENEEHRTLRRQIRDSVCMILEFDNAYRFRFQDIIVELDKVSLRKSPGKEIVRLLTLMQTREKGQDLKDTWTLLKFFIPGFLFINRKLRKDLVEVLTDLDLTKVALTVEDKSYCYPRKDYHFGFVLNPSEEDKLLIAKFQASLDKKEKQKTIRDESTAAHEALFAKHKAEFTPSLEVDQKVQREMQTAQVQISDGANRQLEEFRKSLLDKYLTPEQLAILARHSKEVAEMDKEYTDKLSAIDTEYVSN